MNGSRRTRKTARLVPEAVALAILAFGTGACALFVQEPTVRIAGVRVTSVGLAGATAEIGLEIDNPNGFSLTTTGVSYRLDFRDGDGTSGAEGPWRTLVEGESEEVVTVPGDETVRVTLSVPFRYADVGRAVTSFLELGALHYRLRGVVRLDAPLGGVRVPFDRTGDVGA